MKKNVKQNLALAAAAVILLNFSSCGKYEEGPGFSLRSKKARLTGEWEITEMEDEDGDDMLGDAEIIFEFEKDGGFESSYEVSFYGYTYKGSDDGEWEWMDGKEGVEVDFDDSDDEEFTILRLTNDELWFEDDDDNYYEAEKVE